MRLLRTSILGCAVLSASSFAGACGSGDEAPAPATDAGNGGSSTSSGGTAGRAAGGAPAKGGASTTGGATSTGGRSSTGGASAGGSNTGGASTGGAASTGGNLGTGGATPDSGSDASNPGDAGSDGSTDGGSVACAADGGGTWHDYAAGNCRACPAALPTCDDLLGAPATFNPTTKVLVFRLKPGVTELRRANFTGYFFGVTVDGGNGLDKDGVVDRNTLTFDLSSQLPDGFTQLDGGVVHFTDACGASDSTSSGTRVLQLVVNNLDGGGHSYTFACYDNV